jgi:hypothetical protein
MERNDRRMEGMSASRRHVEGENITLHGLVLEGLKILRGDMEILGDFARGIWQASFLRDPEAFPQITPFLPFPGSLHDRE